MSAQRDASEQKKERAMWCDRAAIVWLAEQLLKAALSSKDDSGGKTQALLRGQLVSCFGINGADRGNGTAAGIFGFRARCHWLGWYFNLR